MLPHSSISLTLNRVTWVLS